MARGEKYELTPEISNLFKECAGMMPVDRIARLIGIRKDCFNEMINNPNHEFSGAFEKARQANSKSAYANIIDRVKKGDMDATKFYLSRMGGWTEKQEIELNKVEEEVVDSTVPIEELLFGKKK